MRVRIKDSILRSYQVFGVFLVLVIIIPVSSWAHGIAGKRFFPTTLAVDDPFMSDEFSLVISNIKETGDDPSPVTTEVHLDISKRITPHFGIDIGDSFLHQSAKGQRSQNGFSNLDLGTKYQFLTDARHEMILSVGVDAELGGTGTRHMGQDSFSTISPSFYFGKGFGDLPDSVKYLKPIAITGVIGPDFPTRSKNVSFDPSTGAISMDRNPVTFSWGLAFEYSFQYLQTYVKDIGFGAPFNRMIFLTEFPMQTCLDAGCGGQTTGFVDPGFVWFGKYSQFGIEAQVPVNSASGKNVGVLALIHFFIDDLFPNSIGRPIFQ